VRDEPQEKRYDFSTKCRFALELMFIPYASTAQRFSTRILEMTIWPDMPDCGAYLVWPCDGSAWIHPEDVELASRWIPSTRVLRRIRFDGEFYHLRYGEQSIRVRPTMWHRVADEGFDVGDQVEVLGRFLENDPCIGRIVEIRYDKSNQRVLYTVESRELPLPRSFLADDLKPLNRRVELRESDSHSNTYQVPSSNEVKEPS
jgi:hypothetical protein